MRPVGRHEQSFEVAEPAALFTQRLDQAGVVLRIGTAVQIASRLPDQSSLDSSFRADPYSK
jgi:hypothetical protein